MAYIFRATFSFIIFYFFSFFAFAEGGLFGPEWTFTNKNLISDSSYMLQATGKTLKLWVQEIEKQCPICFIKKEGNFYRFSYEVYLNKKRSAPIFTITRDEMVFEVHTPPHSIKEFKESKSAIQELVFDTAKLVGLTAHERIGGGHIHLDRLTHFRGSGLLLRNFIVDIFNHPELFMGALSHDYLNAPPLALLSSSAREKFKEILRKYDERKLTLTVFLRSIIKEVYQHSDNEFEKVNQILNRDNAKYNVLSFSNPFTIELRGLQPQKSSDHYLLMLNLLEARINYLSRLNQPISYKEKDYTRSFSATISYTDSGKKLHNYKTFLLSEQIIGVYKKYVEESGLKWNDYKDFIADKRLNSPSKVLYHFTQLNSSKFDKIFKKAACTSLFK